LTLGKTSQAQHDKKPLGFFALLTLGINATIGVGIFFAPSAVAATTPGYTGSLVYLLTGLAMLPVAFIYGHLGGRFSEDGGPYVWARLAFGPAVAFFIGWLTYASALFSAATVATGLSQHLTSTIGPALGPKSWAVLCVLVLALATASGLRLSALAWSTVTVLKLVPLLMLTLLALAASLLGEVPQAVSETGSHVLDVGRALLIVAFALQGFEVVPVLAGSTHTQRTVPWATLGSLVMCTLFYAVLHAICVRALPDLAHQKTPLVAAARVYGGELSGRLVSAGQIVSAIGIAFGQYAITPRYLAALGRTEALGLWIGQEDARRVPQRALWVTTAGVLVFVLREELSGLFALSSIAVLAQYAVATLALAVLAHRGHQGVARKQMAWALPALFGIALVARGAEAKELVTTAAVTAFGAVLMLWRKARKASV
jgi:basic amino acid/polyamine antiporter, APA family